MSTIKMTSTAMIGVNKAGTLKPDANGWYTVVLGALEFPNSYGAYYSLESAKRILDGDAFQRRLKKGQLIGELGHPRQLPGQSTREFYARLMDIHEQNESHTIRSVTINMSAQDRYGRGYIGIMGEVKPSGPHRDVLEQKFADPDMDVCFSIRSFTADKYIGGRLIKNLQSIVTWDYVGEPGLHVAEKYNAPGLESFVGDMMISEIEVPEQAFQDVIDNNRRLGLESAGSTLIAMEMLENIKRIQEPFSTMKRPAFFDIGKR